jgi:hypothetical protein
MTLELSQTIYPYVDVVTDSQLNEAQKIMRVYSASLKADPSPAVDGALYPCLQIHAF